MDELSNRNMADALYHAPCSDKDRTKFLRLLKSAVELEIVGLDKNLVQTIADVSFTASTEFCQIAQEIFNLVKVQGLNTSPPHESAPYGVPYVSHDDRQNRGTVHDDTNRLQKMTSSLQYRVGKALMV